MDANLRLYEEAGVVKKPWLPWTTKLLHNSQEILWGLWVSTFLSTK